MRFGVPRGLASPLTELFDVIERQLVPGQMQEAVEEHAAVSPGKDKPIPVMPAGIGGIVSEMFRPEEVGHRRCTHWHTRVARFRLLDSVHCERANGIDAELVECRRVQKKTSSVWFVTPC